MGLKAPKPSTAGAGCPLVDLRFLPLQVVGKQHLSSPSPPLGLPIRWRAPVRRAPSSPARVITGGAALVAPIGTGGAAATISTLAASSAGSSWIPERRGGTCASS